MIRVKILKVRGDVLIVLIKDFKLLFSDKMSQDKFVNIAKCLKLKLDGVLF